MKNLYILICLCILPFVADAQASANGGNASSLQFNTKASFNVFPNPVVGNKINIQFNNPTSQNITIKVIDVIGNELMVLVSDYKFEGEHTFTFPLNENIKTGMYFIRVETATEVLTKRISVQ